MSCKNDLSKQKNATNNQWASSGQSSNSSEYRDKTATDNQWVSTNKDTTSG